MLTGEGPLGAGRTSWPGVLGAARLRTAYKGVEFLAVRRRLPKRLDGLTLLDVGSGIGQQAGLLSWSARFVVGADSNEEALCYGAANYRPGRCAALACDVGALPLPDACVDLVTSFGVLEHLDDPSGVLRELHRVLKPGGQVALTADCLRGEEEQGFPLSSFKKAFDVKSLYDVPSLYAAMTSAGFEVTCIGYAVSSRPAMTELRRYLAGSREPPMPVKVASLVRLLLAEHRLASPRTGQFVLVDAVRPEVP